MSIKLSNSEDFLKKYNLPEDALTRSDLEWQNLEEIYSHHIINTPNLEPTANDIAARLRNVSEVHSLKIRIKDAEHLIEKLIRKKLENPERAINLDNYEEQITDLIGVRALHLFKEEWERIHDFLAENFNFNETPVAYVREGDCPAPKRYSKLKARFSDFVSLSFIAYLSRYSSGVR